MGSMVIPDPVYGVGAMIVGGLSSMWKIRPGITNAIRQLKSSFGHLAATVSRTEQDLSKYDSWSYPASRCNRHIFSLQHHD